MYRIALIIAALVEVLSAPPSAGQNTEHEQIESNQPPADGEQAQPAGAEAPPDAGQETGDVLILTSGKRMSGVQVLRGNPEFYEVQVLEGMRPLQIPRRLVKEVIYDNIDPIRDRLERQLFPQEQEVTIASGERVTSAIRDKLMAPVSTGPLSYQNRDFVEILEELKSSLDVNLRINQSIRDLQPRQRLWTVEIPVDTTLLAFLREELVGAFDFVEVIFESDRIIVLTKEAAKNRAANQPPVNPAPPPVPPPGGPG